MWLVWLTSNSIVRKNFVSVHNLFPRDNFQQFTSTQVCSGQFSQRTKWYSPSSVSSAAGNFWSNKFGEWLLETPYLAFTNRLFAKKNKEDPRMSDQILFSEKTRQIKILAYPYTISTWCYLGCQWFLWLKVDSDIGCVSGHTYVNFCMGQPADIFVLPFRKLRIIGEI